MRMVEDRITQGDGLRRQWLIVVAIYWGVLLASYSYLRQFWLPEIADRWLAIALFAAAVQMAILWWALPFNHRAGEERVFRFLGYANSLTLARGLLACMLAGFLFIPAPAGWLAWIPAILYSLERLIDFGDGYVARITQRTTRLGEILDIEFDGLGVLIAVGLAIQYDKLPAGYLLLGLGRPLFVFGMWLRHRWQMPVYDLPPSEQRRVIAGFQTGFVSLTLWPVLSPTITMLASYLFAIPLLFSFGRDWLVVSGAIDADSAGYQAKRQTFKRVAEGWLPLAARVAGAGLAFALLGQHLAADAVFGLPAPGALRPLLLLLVLLWGLAAMLMLLAIAGRTAAAVLFTFTCFDILNMGLSWENGLLLACAIIVAHLGSGRFALWQPEERFLHAKLGAPRPAGT